MTASLPLENILFLQNISGVFNTFNKPLINGYYLKCLRIEFILKKWCESKFYLKCLFNTDNDSKKYEQSFKIMETFQSQKNRYTKNLSLLYIKFHHFYPFLL